MNARLQAQSNTRNVYLEIEKTGRADVFPVP
jgi:hypothetical protein